MALFNETTLQLNASHWDNKKFYSVYSGAFARVYVPKFGNYVYGFVYGLDESVAKMLGLAIAQIYMKQLFNVDYVAELDYNPVTETLRYKVMRLKILADNYKLGTPEYNTFIASCDKFRESLAPMAECLGLKATELDLHSGNWAIYNGVYIPIDAVRYSRASGRKLAFSLWGINYPESEF